MRLRVLAVRLAGIGIVVAFGVLATAATAGLVTVNTTQNGSLGKILINASGHTLYTGKCTGTCAAKWPPLVVAAGAKPIAGPGVSATLLGTVKRADGKLQVTYHRLPLFLYTGDTKAGDVKGQGLSGEWHAVAPSGSIVTKSVTVSTGKVSGASTGKGSSTGSSSSGSGSSSGSSSGSGSSGGSSSGSGSNNGGGSSAPPTDCANNPGGYGCM